MRFRVSLCPLRRAGSTPVSTTFGVNDFRRLPDRADEQNMTYTIRQFQESDRVGLVGVGHKHCALCKTVVREELTRAFVVTTEDRIIVCDERASREAPALYVASKAACTRQAELDQEARQKVCEHVWGPFHPPYVIGRGSGRRAWDRRECTKCYLSQTEPASKGWVFSEYYPYDYVDPAKGDG